MQAFAFDSFAAALLQAPEAGPWPADAGEADRQRFDVHRNTVLHSLITALAEGFPSVVQLVGERFFQAMAAEAVRASPPRHPVLLAYGADFPEFLECFPPVAGLPYLADVARIDGLRRRAWHAADARPIEPATLATLAITAAAELRVGLHPSAATLCSAFAARSIWQAQNGDADGVSRIDADRAECSLIWRRGDQVHVRSLDAEVGALQASVQALRAAPRLAALLIAPEAAAGFAEALSLGLVVHAAAAATDPLFDPFLFRNGATAAFSTSLENPP